MPGPLDVIDGHGVGVLGEDLGRAAMAVQGITSEHRRKFLRNERYQLNVFFAQ